MATVVVVVVVEVVVVVVVVVVHTTLRTNYATCAGPTRESDSRVVPAHPGTCV